MAVVGVPVTDLRPYMTCPKCRAPLEKLVVGGVGDWRQRILCGTCQHIQAGLSFENVILPLVAEKFGISYQAARRADETSQEEYVEVCLGGENFKDLPAMPPVPRWLARRKIAAGEEL